MRGRGRPRPCSRWVVAAVVGCCELRQASCPGGLLCIHLVGWCANRLRHKDGSRSLFGAALQSRSGIPKLHGCQPGSTRASLLAAKSTWRSRAAVQVASLPAWGTVGQRIPLKLRRRMFENHTHQEKSCLEVLFSDSGWQKKAPLAGEATSTTTDLT